MRKSVLLEVPRCIFPLAAVAIILVFSISVFTIRGSDDDLYFLGPQYLSSETQDDDPDCNERGSPSIINVWTFPAIPGKHGVPDYLPEKETGLQVSPSIIFLHLNRAPPLE